MSPARKMQLTGYVFLSDLNCERLRMLTLCEFVQLFRGYLAIYAIELRLFVSLCPLLSDSAEVRHHPAGTIIAASWHRSVNTCHHNMLGIYMSVVCQLQDYSKGR